MRQATTHITACFTHLSGCSFEALLRHFGAASFKKLLVMYHPDRTPQVITSLCARRGAPGSTQSDGCASCQHV